MEKNNSPVQNKPLIHRLNDIETKLSFLHEKVNLPKEDETAEKKWGLEQNLTLLQNEIENIQTKINDFEADIKEIKLSQGQAVSDSPVFSRICEEMKDLNTRQKDVEEQVRRFCEDVYAQTNEIVELIMLWDKRLTNLENQTKEINKEEKKQFEEISKKIKTQDSLVKIMKSKQDVLNRIREAHGA